MKRISIVTCLSIVLINLGCKQEHHSEHEATKYVVTTPLQKDTMIYQNYVCQIHSTQHIELRALERGYLQNIYVDEGQFVKKGQLMFQILPSLYKAEMQSAKAEKDYTEIEYLTTKSLHDSNIVSSSELALSKAKLDKAKAILELAKTHLGFTEIRAPFDGIMGRFYVRLGSMIEEGELMTTLSDNDQVWVYFNVTEAEYLSYKLSRLNNVHLPKVKLQMANNELFNQEGEVETIEADFNNETGNIAFRATFDNPQGILRHGETGNILMPLSFKNAVIIPQKATFEILDKKYVYVVDQNNTVHAREIEVGAELPHLYVVKKGVSKNDKILLEGLRKVKNNQKIQYTTKSIDKELSELHKLFAE
jgi:membrane fusion protein (multidrug efflux system)